MTPDGFTTYWIMLDRWSPLPHMRSGLHRVEAQIGPKWVRVRRPGASRGRRVLRLRWDPNVRAVEDTGQTFPEMLAQFSNGGAACSLKKKRSTKAG